MVIKKEHPNIKILEAAIHKLGPLVDEMVFLGGCAICLLLTDPATPPPRVTYDDLEDLDAVAHLIKAQNRYFVSIF